MLKNSTIIISFFLFVQIGFSQEIHQKWNELLTKHVDKNGFVNYKSFIMDSNQLNIYLKKLETQSPQKSWSKNEVMAFWINAYNAFTVQLILRNYPVKSIKDIGGKIPFVNSTWDIKFIKIGNELLDLNNIEHTKLRKQFHDPRLHMVLVCASKSCPVLRREAFTAQRLFKQMDEQTKSFLKDPSRNSIKSSEAKLSMIFKWYGKDFKGKKGIVDFINKYQEKKIDKKSKISYLDYDWSINESPEK
ncbi:MAG: DUF547 domain-containing protein [Bacteroidota bacterium]|nr:DUF547 domain-containing protein [Bacteroidota bacterium]